MSNPFRSSNGQGPFGSSTNQTRQNNPFRDNSPMNRQQRPAREGGIFRSNPFSDLDRLVPGTTYSTNQTRLSNPFREQSPINRQERPYRGIFARSPDEGGQRLIFRSQSPLFGRRSHNQNIFDHSGTDNPFEKGENKNLLQKMKDNSVWIEMPSQVKQLIDEQKFKENKFQFVVDKIKVVNNLEYLIHPFEHKNIGLFNTCFKTTGRFYVCFTCQKFQSEGDRGSQCAICEECFEQSEHEGHIYEQATASRRDNLFGQPSPSQRYCVCGKDAFCNQTSRNQHQIQRCKKHVKENKLKKDFPFSQQKFTNYFGSLYQLLVLLQQSINVTRELKILNNTIVDFIKDSPQNCLLTTEMFIARKYKKNTVSSTRRVVQNKQMNLIFSLPNSCPEIIQILISNYECLRIITQCLVKFQEKNDNLFAKQHIRHLFQHVSAIQIAIKQKAFHFLNYDLIRIASLYSPKNYNYLLEFLEFHKSKNCFNIWYKICEDLLANIKISQVLKQIGAQILPLLLKAFSYFFINIKKQKSQNQQDDRSNSSEERPRRKFSPNQIIFITIIARIMFSIAQTKRQKIRDCRQLFPPLLKFSDLSQDKEDKEVKEEKEKEKQEEKHEQKEKEKEDKRNISERLQQQNQEEKQKISFTVRKQDFVPLFEEYLKWMVENYNTKLTGTFSNSMKLLVHLCIIKSPNKAQLIEKFTQSFVSEPVNIQRSSSLFSRHNNQVKFEGYECILTSIRICLLSKIYMTRYEKNNFRNKQQIQKSREYRRKKLLQFFSEVKVFSPKKLQISKTFFNVPDFNDIVKEHLIYNFESELFFFSQKCQFPNRLMFLFNEDGKNPNNQNIHSTKIYFDLNCQKSFEQELNDQVQMQCLKSIVLESSYFNKLMSMFKKFMEKLQKNNQLLNQAKKIKFGCKIVEIIVVIFLLSEGKHEGARDEIKKIKQNKSQFDLYEFVGDREQLMRILCLSEEKNQKNKTKQQKQGQKIQQKIDQRFKEKAELKKKQAHQKMKEKQAKAISKLQTDSLNRVPSEEGDFCIICRQKSKKNNQLVYLVKAVSNYTLSSCLYEQNNKMKTQLSSCFHAIHVQCYLKREKKFSMSHNETCKLCGKAANCILPERYDAREKKLLRICTNSIISAFFSEYDNYDIENLFILLLRHLVESKTFITLTNVAKYSQSRRKRQKIDYFIEDFASNMYSNGTQNQKLMYDESIEELKNEIEICQDEVSKKIQYLVINTLVEKFKTGIVSVDLQKLSELALKMESQEFLLIKCEVQDIGKQFTNEEQLNLNHLLNENEKQERKKRGKDFPIKPPQFVHQLKTFGNKNCHFCKNTVRQTMCLICGFQLCNRCEGSKGHLKFHQDKILSFIYNEAVLQYEDFNSQRRNNNGGLFGGGSGHLSQKVNLYFTDLMIPFSERTLNHQKEVFKINDSVFEKYYAQF